MVDNSNSLLECGIVSLQKVCFKTISVLCHNVLQILEFLCFVMVVINGYLLVFNDIYKPKVTYITVYFLLVVLEAHRNNLCYPVSIQGSLIIFRTIRWVSGWERIFYLALGTDTETFRDYNVCDSYERLSIFGVFVQGVRESQDYPPGVLLRKQGSRAFEDLSKFDADAVNYHHLILTDKGGWENFRDCLLQVITCDSWVQYTYLDDKSSLSGRHEGLFVIFDAF